MEEINKLREKIDDIDNELTSLIEKRAQVAKEIGEIKNKEGIGVVQPEREKKVLENIKLKLTSIPPESVEAVWKEIMSACKVVQGKITRVCYLGPQGTFTEIASKKIFPKAGSKFIAVKNKQEVFSKVEGDYAEFGIVPIENSLEGSVRESLDLLIEKNLKIYGETEIRIVHNLIAAKGTKISDIKMVLSHPQALSQCNTWLLKNIPNVELMETSSTARAVEKVKGNKNYAAIGTKLAAKLNNLEIISAGIEENTQNFTRFLVISKKENMPTKNDKISMVFVVKHIPGALHQVIKIFAEANINLLKIESRPRKSQMWEYFFLMDFEGSILDQKIQDTLEKMKEFTIWHKILGSYPRNF